MRAGAGKQKTTAPAASLKCLIVATTEGFPQRFSTGTREKFLVAY
jgi:hypothetical protein